MNFPTVAELLEEAADMDITAYEISNNLNITETSLSRWRHGTRTPNITSYIKIYNYVEKYRERKNGKI